MWQLIARRYFVEGFRWVLFPVAILIGAVGVQAEQVFNKEKIERDNKGLPPAWERRNTRHLEEMESAKDSKSSS
jgi:hypothetical protein